MKQQPGKFKILIYGEFFLPVVGGVQTAMNLLAKGLVGLNSQPAKEQGLGTIEVTIATRTAAGGMDGFLSFTYAPGCSPAGASGNSSD